MTTSTTIKSPGALALGVFFTAITLRTIFDDVWNGATFTIAHLNAIGALVAAIAAGHLVWPMLKQFRLPAALGLAIIFAASTYYIATSAASRNAEADAQKTARIVKTNAERATLRQKVTQAEADVEDARASHTAAKRDAAKECGSGKATKCDGKTATRDYAAADLEKAESHASMMRGKLSLLGPDEQVHEGYKRAGEVFASAGYGNAPEIAGKLAVQMPFLAVLINEVATLVFLGMGLSHTAAPSQAAGSAQAESPATNKETATASRDVETDSFGQSGMPAIPDSPEPTNVIELFAERSGASGRLAEGVSDAPKPNGPKGGQRVRVNDRKEAVQADMIARDAAGERFESQEDLRAALIERFGYIAKSTLCDWRSELERSGRLPQRHTVNRVKAFG